MSDRLYTLDEARLELSREKCLRQGHDYQILVAGTGEPSALVCTRCGRSWPIQPTAEEVGKPLRSAEGSDSR